MFYSHYSQILHRLQQLSHTGILRLVENVAVIFREGEVKSLSSHAVSIQPRRLTNSLAYLDADVDACVRLLNAKYTRKWTNIFGGYLPRSEVASGGIGRINRFCNDKTIMQSNRQKKKISACLGIQYHFALVAVGTECVSTTERTASSLCFVLG